MSPEKNVLGGPSDSSELDPPREIDELIPPYTIARRLCVPGNR